MKLSCSYTLLALWMKYVTLQGLCCSIASKNDSRLPDNLLEPTLRPSRAFPDTRANSESLSISFNLSGSFRLPNCQITHTKSTKKTTHCTRCRTFETVRERQRRLRPVGSCPRPRFFGAMRAAESLRCTKKKLRHRNQSNGVGLVGMTVGKAPQMEVEPCRICTPKQPGQFLCRSIQIPGHKSVHPSLFWYWISRFRFQITRELPNQTLPMSHQALVPSSSDVC